MQYKYAKEHPDYSDLASGRVFYSLPGYPAFPVRLASEIFQRCVTIRKTTYNNSTPCTLYDPCCGAAYHLSVLAYLHGEHIQKIIGSDVNENAISLAARNLGLLTASGLDTRIAGISNMIEQYGKDSHKEALRSAHILKSKIISSTKNHPLETRVFQSSATDEAKIAKNIKAQSIDIVFTDVPYGQHSHWHDSDSDGSSNPLREMLDALLGVLSPSSVVAIVSDKKQKGSHERYQRVEQFQIGKRRTIFLIPT